MFDVNIGNVKSFTFTFPFQYLVYFDFPADITNEDCVLILELVQCGKRKVGTVIGIAVKLGAIHQINNAFYFPDYQKRHSVSSVSRNTK